MSTITTLIPTIEHVTHLAADKLGAYTKWPPQTYLSRPNRMLSCRPVQASSYTSKRYNSEKDWRAALEQDRAPGFVAVLQPDDELPKALQCSQTSSSGSSSTSATRQSSATSLDIEECCREDTMSGLNYQVAKQNGSYGRSRAISTQGCVDQMKPRYLPALRDEDIPGFDNEDSTTEHSLDRRFCHSPLSYTDAERRTSSPAIRPSQIQASVIDDASISSQSLEGVPVEANLCLSMDSQTSSTSTDIRIDSTIDSAGPEAFDLMAVSPVQEQNSTQTEPVRSDTNDSRSKGKAKLTSIGKISWDLIEEQDVRSFCQAFDKSHRHMTENQHVKMGAVVSVYEQPLPNASFQSSSPIAPIPPIAAPPASSTSNDANMAKHKRFAVDDSPYKPSRQARTLKLQVQTRQSERLREQQRRRIEEHESRLNDNALREQERRRRIVEYESRLSDNEKILSDRLKRLHDETEALIQEQEKVKVELQRRREREDYLAALALEKRWNEEIEARRQAEERARRKECTVCGDDKDMGGFPTKAATAKCQHDSHTCSDCLDSWIASSLNDNGIDGIKCPECPEKLAYQDVQTVASQATFEAYDKATIMQTLSSLPDFAWCLSPTCKSGQLNTENSNYMECVSCGYKQCLQHKVPWHAGETCEKYEHRTSGAQAKEEEEKTLAMLDSMSKVCPGPNCGWRIQKTDGCDHVTCRKCRFEFCWQCLASHAEIKRVGNTAHKKDCKFHSTNLDLAWPFNRH